MIIPIPILVEGFTSSLPEIFNFYAQWAPIFTGISALINAPLFSV
ncbi:hypothetical protein NQ015_02955 [Corynebacterium sp. 153RC1]|nr:MULTISPECIES: hypothetical protein [unclassified Corynebacterium]MCQ9370056.1 hypothetical protein [Corynebacterium sp. 35RC1]MCQ9351830.1 hypothetical protein [Corynebacterium sp. 209RC1]MCQ9354987.1 hypothetical protein [Corynebacterium sp. 1222RC1]MCQ9356112.1 hypothetical protein [Corynebacterium sp. 122RC1]MCQ9359507.1 hypothetical protein [Corynebacterium sp. 142RC1]